MNSPTISDVSAPEQTFAATELSDEEFYDLLKLCEEKPPILPEDLIGLSTAEVRKLCNLAFHEMDTDFPRGRPPGTKQRIPPSHSTSGLVSREVPVSHVLLSGPIQGTRLPGSLEGRITPGFTERRINDDFRANPPPPGSHDDPPPGTFCPSAVPKTPQQWRHRSADTPEPAGGPSSGNRTKARPTPAPLCSRARTSQSGITPRFSPPTQAPSNGLRTSKVVPPVRTSSSCPRRSKVPSVAVGPMALVIAAIAAHTRPSRPRESSKRNTNSFRPHQCS